MKRNGVVLIFHGETSDRMALFIKKMTRSFAKEILNWKYEAPYDLYNNSINEDAIKELLENSYSAIVDEQNELVGFFCIGQAAHVPAGNKYGAYAEEFIDIGIGMKPERTGKGFGKIFFSFILRYIEEANQNIPIRLTVAKFNERAIRLYEKIGFERKIEFSNGHTIFITMVKDTQWQLPKPFITTIKEIHKEKGKQWLLQFQKLIKECEQRWQIKIMPPFDLSYNFVAPAIREDGSEVVIKLVVPGEEFLHEAEALALFNGVGMVKVIDTDREKGILILERLLPGDTLALLENDEEATIIASQVMKKLWCQAPELVRVPYVKSRAVGLTEIYEEYPEGLGPITKEMLKEASDIFKRMIETPTPPYLLHGDLHHYNILKSGTHSWRAIDPKGLVGDREYDVIQFLLNKLPKENVSLVIEKRIEILVENLDLDRNKILLYGFSHAVLATCWSIQDSGTYEKGFSQAINVFKNLISLENESIK